MNDVNDLIEEGESYLSDAEQESKDLFSSLSLAAFVNTKFQEARLARLPKENDWIEAFWAYRGRYTPEQQSRIRSAQERNPGSSNAYIKITKTKVLAAYGQVIEILFSGNKFPISIEPTPVPEGAADSVYLESSKNQSQDTSQSPKDIYGFKGDGNDPEPGATTKSLLGSLADKFMPYLKNKTVKDGEAPDRTKLIELHPAEEAARSTEKVIHDQLIESMAADALDSLALEAATYGTGIIKGPFSYVETIHKYDQDPKTKQITYTPYRKQVPKIEHVSLWNAYPDPEARTIYDASYMIERHLLNRPQMRDLNNMPFFDQEALKRVLKNPPRRQKEGWEDTLIDNNILGESDRYEVLEFWGEVDAELAEQYGLDMEEYFEENSLSSVQVNVWICENEVLRKVVNPFVPQRIPYFFVPYEKVTTQIWGVGIPENMKDTQAIMNGHLRMAIDNLRLAGSVMLEVNENQLVPGQDMTIYPGKIWRKQGGAPGQSIYSLQVNNTSQSHLMMFDKARQLADEAVGLPSFSHGQTGVSGTGRTAAGISMLMTAAAGSIKTVIKNFDRYLLEPLGNAMFQWNMQFNEENVTIRGDVKIVATGTKSLMQKEVLTQRLLSFLQLTSGNPATQVLVNVPYIIKQLAISMDLDADKIVNDPQMAALYAELMSKANGNIQGTGNETVPNAGSQGPGNPPSGGINPADPTGAGGGQIGVGSAPGPGQAGFSGAT